MIKNIVLKLGRRNVIYCNFTNVILSLKEYPIITVLIILNIINSNFLEITVQLLLKSSFRNCCNFSYF